jgi:hypothetical protein
MYTKPATVLLIAILAASCADLRWQKAGADSAALEQDLEKCEREARLRAGQEAMPRLVSAPVITTDPQGRTFLTQPPPHNTERFLHEQDLTRACMRKQGYELVRQERRRSEEVKR